MPTCLTDSSWWPFWQAWLAARSGPLGKPPRMSRRGNAALPEAPCHHVTER
jgi:polyhydroxyalkanoate synthase